MTDSILINRVSLHAKSTLPLAVGASCLSWFVLGRINQWYSRRTLNNGATDSSWDWSKEIVLLTGGSSGIGAAIANELALKKVKVIILDMHAPLQTQECTGTEERDDICS